MSKDAKPDTWMPLVIGDYLKDTTRLTTEQHGAYLLLIMSYWVDGPPLDDDEDLAAITGLDAKAWKKNRPKLERFFRVEAGVWRHKRIDLELDRWTEKKAMYAERAAAGGRAKAAKRSASSTPQALFKQQKTGEKSCLKSAPQPASTEVDVPTGQSTLCDEFSISDLKEDRNTEREWAIDKQRAEDELILAKRQDPDLASELEEFIQVAKDRLAEMRRARLSVVAA